VIVNVDLDALAELVIAERDRHPAGTPGRRAAGHLHACLQTTPSIDAARRAIGTFGDDEVQAAALELLGRLALKAER
jgi:hypothetical protein